MPLLGIGRGTLLNTATVAAGALVGLALRGAIPPEYQKVVLSGLGLVTLGMGMKMFFASKNVLVVAAAIAVGGILGTLLGIQLGIEAFGDWAKQTFGGQGSATFTEGVVTASILFCVGPMTLMGCLEEAIEGKMDLIAVKSTLDGFAAAFLAVSLGPGVLVSALVVFAIQGTLTALGRKLQWIAKDERIIAEATGSGGPMLLGTGLGLLGIASLPVANFLPALVLAPLFVLLGDRFPKRQEG